MGNREVFASLKRSSRPNLLHKQFRAKPVPTVLLSAGRVPFKHQGSKPDMTPQADQTETAGAVSVKEGYEVEIPSIVGAQGNLVASAENVMDLDDKEPDNTGKPQEYKNLYPPFEGPQFTESDESVPVAPVGQAVVQADELPEKKTISSKFMKLKSKVRALLGMSKTKVFSRFRRVGCGLGRECEVESDGVVATATPEITEDGTLGFCGSHGGLEDEGSVHEECNDPSSTAVGIESDSTSNGGVAVDQSLLSESSFSYRSFHSHCSRFGGVGHQGSGIGDARPDVAGLVGNEGLGYGDGPKGLNTEYQCVDAGCAEEEVVPWQEVMRRVEARRERDRTMEYVREKKERSKRFYARAGPTSPAIGHSNHAGHDYTYSRHQTPGSYGRVAKNPVVSGVGVRWLTDDEIPVDNESSLGVDHERSAGLKLLESSGRRFNQLVNRCRSVSKGLPKEQPQYKTTHHTHALLPHAAYGSSPHYQSSHTSAEQFMNDLSHRIARIQEEAERFVREGIATEVVTGALGHQWVDESDIPVMEESQIDENEASVVEQRLLAASRKLAQLEKVDSYSY